MKSKRLTELSVDSSDQLVDDSAEILVFFDVLSGRNGNLDQHNLTDPLRVLGQEDFEGVQLLGNTLDVVETVNTNDQLDALELALKSGNTLHDLGLLESFLELLGVDADGECANGDDLSLKLDRVRRGGKLTGNVSIASQGRIATRPTGFWSNC